MEKIFDKPLKVFMAQFGDNQTDAAKALGVTQSHLNNLLKGRKKMTPRIAAKLGFKRDWVRL